jgi:hypothetical protein
MFRRAVVEAQGGYDEANAYGEDYALWAALSARHALDTCPKWCCATGFTGADGRRARRRRAQAMVHGTQAAVLGRLGLHPEASPGPAPPDQHGPWAIAEVPAGSGFRDAAEAWLLGLAAANAATGAFEPGPLPGAGWHWRMSAGPRPGRGSPCGGSIVARPWPARPPGQRAPRAGRGRTTSRCWPPAPALRPAAASRALRRPARALRWRQALSRAASEGGRQDVEARAACGGAAAAEGRFFSARLSFRRPCGYARPGREGRRGGARALCAAPSEGGARMHPGAPSATGRRTALSFVSARRTIFPLSEPGCGPGGVNHRSGARVRNLRHSA